MVVNEKVSMTTIWLFREDLNFRPSRYQHAALPLSYGTMEDVVEHLLELAPEVGFEPTTNWLTASYSTTELHRNKLVEDMGLEPISVSVQGKRAYPERPP